MIDVIVIGGGPAGITAALYVARSGKTVKLLERQSFGGQIAMSPRVENYPSIKSISGVELIDRMVDQAIDAGVDVDVEDVIKLKKNGDTFIVTTEYSTYETSSVIIASGATHRKIICENSDKFEGKGISYCAVCDGSFYENEDVCLIGDGNSALQYALQLSNYCRKVYVVTLFDKFFGEKSVEKLLYGRSNVEIIHNSELVFLGGDDELEFCRFYKKDENKHFEVNCKGLFVAIGQIPHNDVFKEFVDLDEQGFILTDENLQTKTPGLYAAGDCRRKVLRQVTTAVSDGSIAAVSACRYIEK